LVGRGWLHGGTRNRSTSATLCRRERYIGLGQAYDLPKIWTYNNYHLVDTMSWSHGRHNVKFGGDALRYQYNNKYFNDLRGRMTFLGRFTGEPMADFLLGYVQSSRHLVDISKEYLQGPPTRFCAGRFQNRAQPHAQSGPAL